ncbi:hypothetical protein FACS189431_5320 [Alphaproteobacteria bacterium]|nr:hypothetical protein FACS189431_5320 [Alphaproteobacteria bacterium]
MKKDDYQLLSLEHGAIWLYDLGNIKMHAYKSNDMMDDVVFILEKNNQAVTIENPSFAVSVKELTEYVKGLGVKAKWKLPAYHMAGAHYLPGAGVHSTVKAGLYAHSGGGFKMVQQFKKNFKKDFDADIDVVTHPIVGDSVELGGIRFNIITTDEAFDIEIPEINTLYTHMLGNHVHSLVISKKMLKGTIQRFMEYKSKGYDLVISSHHMPEDDLDLIEKIAYLENLGKIADNCVTADEFKTRMHVDYPDYTGDNYLEMTAHALFAS